jgi:hypothetical protein
MQEEEGEEVATSRMVAKVAVPHGRERRGGTG